MRNMSFDLHYLKSGLIFLGAFLGVFFYVFGAKSLDDLTFKHKENSEQILRLNQEIKSNTSKLKTFNEKIINIDKFFVKDKKDFGLYKLMEHLDEEIKMYKYKYTTDQKMKKMTNKYFYYNFKFVIKYESYESAMKILKTIEEKYHNSFVDAKFEKGKFILVYKFYGKKGI